jgi:hypothetical protein
VYLNDVVLRNHFRYNLSKCLIQSTGSFRYDLFDGNITMDDVVAVTPFEDDIYKVSERTLGADIIAAFGPPNQVAKNGTKGTVIINGRVVDLPEYAMTGTIHPDQYYDLYTQEISVSFIQETLQNVTNSTAFPPEQQFRQDGSSVTTLSLWLDFIDNHWSCDDSSVVKVANRWLFVLFSAAAAFIFFGYRFFRHYAYTNKRNARQGYDNGVAIEEDEDMIL